MGGSKGKSKGGAKGRGGGKKPSGSGGGNRGGKDADARALRTYVANPVELAWVASGDEATRDAFLDHAASVGANALETSFAAVRECVEQNACSDKVKGVAVHALALVRSGEAGKLISAQSTRTTRSALVSGDTHSDPSTPTSLDAPRRSISSSTVDSIDDSDSDSDGEDATSRKRDEELARCLLGSAVGGGGIAARDFDVVEAPVDSELGATVRFITTGNDDAPDADGLRAAIRRGLDEMKRANADLVASSEETASSSKKQKEGGANVSAKPSSPAPTHKGNDELQGNDEDPTLYYDIVVDSYDQARRQKADLEEFGAKWRREWHAIAGLQATCVAAGKDWDDLADACHAWMKLSDRRREFQFEKMVNGKLKRLKLQDEAAREQVRIRRSFDARHGGDLGGGPRAANQTGFLRPAPRAPLSAKEKDAVTDALDNLQRRYEDSQKVIMEEEKYTPKDPVAVNLIAAASAAAMSYLKFLTSQQMRLSETNGATREKYAAAMVKDASIVDDVVGSQSSSAADDAIAAALDAARHAKSGGGANDAADAAAATFAAVGKSSNGGGRSAAEKFSDDWDKEREAGATSIQRAEWLAMSTTERDAEMAVRGERATRVYTFQSRWNQLLDTLANKQKMMHGKAFKGFWDTRDLLQHVQTMEREVFKWLEGHKREVTKAEIKLVALMERRGESNAGSECESSPVQNEHDAEDAGVAGPRLRYDGKFPSVFLNRLKSLGDEYDERIRVWRDEVNAAVRAVHEAAAATVGRAMFTQTCARVATTFADLESERRTKEFDDLSLFDEDAAATKGSKKKPKKKKTAPEKVQVTALDEKVPEEEGDATRTEAPLPMDDSAAENDTDSGDDDGRCDADRKREETEARTAPSEIEEWGSSPPRSESEGSHHGGVNNNDAGDGSDWVAAGPKPRKTREQKERERLERIAAERLDLERTQRTQRELRERKAREREQLERRRQQQREEEAAAARAAAVASGSPPPLPPGPPPSGASKAEPTTPIATKKAPPTAMDINGAKHTNDDDALREAIRISELESKAARAAAAAQAAAEAAIAAAKEAAAMQAEAEAAMTEARKSRETLAKQGSEVHVPLAPQTEDTRGPTAPPPPPGRPPGEQGTAVETDEPMTQKVAEFFAGASNKAKVSSPPPSVPLSAASERARLADFPALSPSAAAGKAAEKRLAPLIAAHKRASVDASSLTTGAKPFDPNMAKAILAGMRDGDPNAPKKDAER